MSRGSARDRPRNTQDSAIVRVLREDLGGLWPSARIAGAGALKQNAPAAGVSCRNSLLVCILKLALDIPAVADPPVA